MCFVMIFPYLLYGVDQASAASNYNHAELMDYEGYGESMYNSIVEETTFVTGQYTDNKEYVTNSIDQIKDYAKFWWEENKIEGEGVGERLKEVFVEGAAYTLTVGDWVKKFFSDTDSKVNPPPVSYEDFYSPYFYVDSYGGALVPRSGYTIEGVVDGESFGPTSYLSYYLTGMSRGDLADASLCFGNDTCGEYQEVSNSEFSSDVDTLGRTTNLGAAIGLISKWGGNVIVHKDDKPLNIGTPSKPTDNNYKKINDYIQNGMDDKQIRVPEPKPSLTCPNGEKINLTVDGSTFLNKDGSVMLVNKDGTATVNGTSCALQWQTPEMGFIDDKAAMTDSEGNWIDMITGDLLQCVVTGECKPSVPGEDEEVEELDNALIEYVKNAYEYATGVLKTATDGLKSLATGAKDLTALFGTFFSWLPKEMVVLMSSGLGIAIGLRLFRK